MIALQEAGNGAAWADQPPLPAPHPGPGPTYPHQHVVAVPMEGVFLSIEGGDVGATLQGAGAGAWEILA